MMSRFEWSGMSPAIAIAVAALALTIWQVQVDRWVFDRFFGSLNPVGMMVGAGLVGLLAIAWLQGSSKFVVSGPGEWRDAFSVVAWTVPMLAAVAIGADLALRYAEDTNVAMPDALRFYPAIAVFAEIVLHVVPVAVLTALFGTPTGFAALFWRIAIPVALIEAVVQALYAPSIGTAIFSAVHLLVFGVVQIWLFWRFGFVWMLGFRLFYYSLWHIAWGVARLELLF